MKAQEAIDLGYEFAIEEGSESLTHLSDVVKNPDDYDFTHFKYWICDKEPRYYSVSAESLMDLIQLEIDDQEDFHSEDLSKDATEGIDDLLEQLSKHINDNCSGRPFFFANQSLRLEH